MASVRGIFFLNTVDFVCDTYERDAHARILEQLPSDMAILLSTAALLRCDATQWSWLPLDGLIVYMEGAKQLYGVDDPDFFRRMGRYGGLGYRSQPIAMIASDPESVADYAGTLWHLLFDTGDVEVVQTGSAETRVRIRGFPAHATLCQRILGSLDGIYAAAQRPARIEKPACVLAGDPYCEFRIITV